jgi:hypothetical protein
MNKKLLIIRVTNDVLDVSIQETFCMARHYNIDVEYKDVSTITELENSLNSGKIYDYVYFAGHGDENFFSDNKNFTASWSQIGEAICKTKCLNDNAIIMLYCCKGGVHTVAFKLMADCPNIKYVCGAKQSVSSIDLMTGFNVFIYNIERKYLDPVLAAAKSTNATDIRFECFDRTDVQINPQYVYNYCKDCKSIL